MSGTTSTDINQNRVDVLGVSVDQSTTWTTFPPASANTLGTAFTGANRIVTRALNFLQTGVTNASNSSDGFVTRFNTIIGEETAADATDWAAIGSNLITAVADLKANAGTGGGGGTWGSITGTLSSQTDLQTALTAAAAAGANTATWGDITGTLSAQNDLHLALGDAAMAAQWGHITGTITSQTDLNTALNGKQATLIGTATAGQNLKTVNGQTLLGTGDVTIDTSTAWGSITGTLSGQSDLQAALNLKADASDLADKQDELISGTNIKTINGTTLLGSGDISTAVTLAGDVTGATNATVVEKLRGRELDITVPTNGQVLAYNATTQKWGPTSAAGGGSIEHFATVQNPVLYRMPNPFGTGIWARGFIRGPTSYGCAALASNDTVWKMDASGPPYLDGNWTSQGTSPVAFTTGYIGGWSPALVSPNYACIFFNKTTTALHVNINTSTAAYTLNSLTLAGLPSGFDVVAMWAAGQHCYAICNNRVFHASVDNTAALPSPLVFNEIMGVAELAAITTKTRVYVERSTVANQYRVLIWGTAPTDLVALYDSDTDTWSNVTTPADHSGGANALIIFRNGRIGFLTPTSRAYTTAEADDNYTTWTTRYTISSTNRRLLSLNGDFPLFFPSAASTQYDIETYRDVAFETISTPWPIAGSSNFPFGTEHLSLGHGGGGASFTYSYFIPPISAQANAGYLASYFNRSVNVIVYAGRSYTAIAQLSIEYMRSSAIFDPQTIANQVTAPLPPAAMPNITRNTQTIMTDLPTGFSGGTIRRTVTSVAIPPT